MDAGDLIKSLREWSASRLHLIDSTSTTDKNLAGISIANCNGSICSVYTGTFTDDYRSIMFQDPETEHKYAATGLSMPMVAKRVSWSFNLKGPSMNLGSACSSSLIASHLACQDLRTGEVSIVSLIVEVVNDI